MKGRRALAAGIAVMLAGAGILQAQPKAKKLIEWGWDFPTPGYLRQNIREMENAPFDGVNFWLIAGCNDPKSEGGTIFSKTKWEESKFEKIYDDCKNIEWKKFTDNFVCVFSASATQADWFSDADWENVRYNLGIVTKAAALARCRGICFDAEAYGNSPWTYPTQLHAKEKTFAEYEAKARQRGAEFVRALAVNMPQCVIHTAFQLSYFQGIMDEPDPAKRVQRLSQHPYSLLPAFLNGVLDAAGPGIVINDGNEDSYYYEKAEDFYRSYHMMRQRALSLIAPENVRKYQAQVQVSQALFMDYVFGRFPSVSLEMTPDERGKWFEHNVYYALATSDEYVWLYSERMNWWKNENLPLGLREAIESARSKLDGQKGLDSEPLDATFQKARSKLVRRKGDVIRLSQPPVIDGKLNDDAWKAGKPLEDFVPLLTRRESKIQAATRTRVAYDDRNLYLAFQCTEPKMDKMKVIAQKQDAGGHDGDIWSDDNLEIFLSQSAGGSPFFHFALNPGNIHWDSFHPEHAVGCYPYAQRNVDAKWQSAVIIGEKEWTVEMAIPWAEIGMSAPGSGSRLGANFCRNRLPDAELSTWSQNIRSFIEDENFGTLEFQ